MRSLACGKSCEEWKEGVILESFLSLISFNMSSNIYLESSRGGKDLDELQEEWLEVSEQGGVSRRRWRFDILRHCGKVKEFRFYFKWNRKLQEGFKKRNGLFKIYARNTFAAMCLVDWNRVMVEERVERRQL